MDHTLNDNIRGTLLKLLKRLHLKFYFLALTQELQAGVGFLKI